jgi:hypothetical protein
MKNWKDQLKFISEMIAALSICFSIIWSLKVDETQNVWLRKVETLNILNNRDRHYMTAIKVRLSDKVLDTITEKNLIKTILTDSILRENITEQLTQFERISIGANIEIYDDIVIKRLIGHNFITFNKSIQPYIRHIRTKSKNPNIYAEYDNCCNRLRNID